MRKIARKHGWYMEEKRKGMVNHVLVPTFKVSAVNALMFFLFVPALLLMRGQYTDTRNTRKGIAGANLLALFWLVTIKPWHLHED